MVTWNFVGDKPVKAFSPEAIQKIPNDKLTKRELERLSKATDKEPGANKRAGVATRDPARSDTKHRDSQRDRLPTKDACPWFEFWWF